MLPTEGNVDFSSDSGPLKVENIYNKISFAAPYMTLFEQLTLIEQVKIHLEFRTIGGLSDSEAVLDKMELNAHSGKRIEDLSSGMKQRLKLGLAMMSDGDMILLDEPISNLDENGRRWYHKMINEYIQNKTVIVCSNKLEEEYNFCTEVLSL